MKKTYSYKDCYQILDIEPSCDWKELRKAYKASIQKWHPDRFEDGSNEKHAAENKIKTINIAYTQINQYYRDNKTLPPVIDNSTNNTVTINYKTHFVKPDKKDQQSPKKPIPQSTVKTSKFPLFTSIILLTASFSLYLVFQPSSNTDSPQNDNNYTGTINKPSIRDALPHIPKKTQKHPEPLISNTNYFTIGSTISDVISAQGPPTRTDGNIWFYGESEIHFSHGEVTHWVRSMNNPLKIKLKK